MAKRRTKEQIQDHKRMTEIAIAIRGAVVAMKPSQAVACDAFSALYRDCLADMLADGCNRPDLRTEVLAIIDSHFKDAFGFITDDLNMLVAPTLKADTFLPPVEEQKAYH